MSICSVVFFVVHYTGVLCLCQGLYSRLPVHRYYTGDLPVHRYLCRWTACMLNQITIKHVGGGMVPQQSVWVIGMFWYNFCLHTVLRRCRLHVGLLILIFVPWAQFPRIHCTSFLISFAWIKVVCPSICMLFWASNYDAFLLMLYNSFVAFDA